MNSRTKTARRAVFAALLVMCANVAAQPCLMAIAEAPQLEAAHAGHEQHPESASHVCSHCPPQAAMQHEACATTLAADCDESPDFSHDGRNTAQKLKDLSSPPAIAGPPEQFFHASVSVSALPLLRDRHTLPGGPPLNLLLCIFLK